MERIWHAPLNKRLIKSIVFIAKGIYKQPIKQKKKVVPNKATAEQDRNNRRLSYLKEKYRWESNLDIFMEHNVKMKYFSMKSVAQRLGSIQPLVFLRQRKRLQKCTGLKMFNAIWVLKDH